MVIQCKNIAKLNIIDNYFIDQYWDSSMAVV